MFINKSMDCTHLIHCKLFVAGTVYLRFITWLGNSSNQGLHSKCMWQPNINMSYLLIYSACHYSLFKFSPWGCTPMPSQFLLLRCSFRNIVHSFRQCPNSGEYTNCLRPDIWSYLIPSNNTPNNVKVFLVCTSYTVQ